MTIALVAPTSIESREIRREIRPTPDDELKKIFEGDLSGNHIIFTHCGVGKVNAAHSATLMLENYDVDILILFGIGGAYPDSKLNIGDIAVAETENYAEEGVLTKEGWRSMEFTGFPLLKKVSEYYNSFPMDKGKVRSSVDALKESGFNVKAGNFVTVSQCSGTRSMGELLRRRFNGSCENMEGAAVAHICALYDIPMIEIRGISNIVVDRDLKKWDINLAASNCCKAVIELVRRLK